MALPHLLGSLCLLLASRAVELAGSRLGFIVRTALLQATLLIPVALLAFLPVPGRIATLILLVTAFRMLGHLIGAAWGSLMSDYLPPEKRGIYFGFRSRVVGIAQIAGMGAAGVILTLTKQTKPAFGFFLIFLAAAAARFISTAYLARMTDLPFKPVPGSDFTFLMFLRRFKESNFVKFVFYVAGITFATHIAAPYFSVFLIRDLNFGYLPYMAIHLAAVVAGLIAVPAWGRHADLVGNARVLKTTGLLVPVIPLLWLVSRNPIYLTGVELFSGLVWGGFNLCATNFVYDAVTPPKRVRCLGYFNLINGVALFLAASLGGFLADRIPSLLGYRLLTLFALSGVLRFLVNLLLARHFQEVRESSRRVSSAQLFFSVVGIRPLLGESPETIFPFLKRFAGKRLAFGGKIGAKRERSRR